VSKCVIFPSHHFPPNTSGICALGNAREDILGARGSNRCDTCLAHDQNVEEIVKISQKEQFSLSPQTRRESLFWGHRAVEKSRREERTLGYSKFSEDGYLF